MFIYKGLKMLLKVTKTNNFNLIKKNKQIKITPLKFKHTYNYICERNTG